MNLIHWLINSNQNINFVDCLSFGVLISQSGLSICSHVSSGIAQHFFISSYHLFSIFWSTFIHLIFWGFHESSLIQIFVAKVKFRVVFVLHLLRSSWLFKWSKAVLHLYLVKLLIVVVLLSHTILLLLLFLELLWLSLLLHLLRSLLSLSLVLDRGLFLWS